MGNDCDAAWKCDKSWEHSACDCAMACYHNSRCRTWVWEADDHWCWQKPQVEHVRNFIINVSVVRNTLVITVSHELLLMCCKRNFYLCIRVHSFPEFRRSCTAGRQGASV